MPRLFAIIQSIMDVLSLDWLLSTTQQAFLISLGLFLFIAASTYLSSFWGAPWVISSKETINQMLSMAELKEGETLYDLGAGDGRILIQAAQNYSANAVGVEIDPIRCILAKIFIRQKNLNKLAKMRWGNIFSTKLENADVITLYLTRDTNLNLREHFEKNAAPGTRIVSNAFTIPGWTPAKIDNRNLIFMYIVGKTQDTTITEFIEHNN